jgi:hypothetical protein
MVPSEKIGPIESDELILIPKSGNDVIHGSVLETYNNIEEPDTPRLLIPPINPLQSWFLCNGYMGGGKNKTLDTL